MGFIDLNQPEVMALTASLDKDAFSLTKMEHGEARNEPEQYDTPTEALSSRNAPQIFRNYFLETPFSAIDNETAVRMDVNST